MKNSQVTDVLVGKDFIRRIIDEDVLERRYGGKVVTRFPPEPNGFLHIGTREINLFKLWDC